MKLQLKILLSALLVIGLSGCNVFGGTQTETIVCNVSVPTLPHPNDKGQVVLEIEDQINLLVYIESLENCLEQAS